MAELDGGDSGRGWNHTVPAPLDLWSSSFFLIEDVRERQQQFYFNQDISHYLKSHSTRPLALDHRHSQQTNPEIHQANNPRNGERKMEQAPGLFTARLAWPST